MALVLENLTKRFGPITALDGITFSVERGSVFGFLGANGAGKTTTMRIILDILRPDSGTATWNGTPTTDVPRKTWGYLPEERGPLPPARSPRATRLLRLALRDPAQGSAPRAPASGSPASGSRTTRSGGPRNSRKGNQQKVQLIAAILHEPEVVIMDEPFVGLDPVNVSLLKEAFVEMRSRGTTLVFSTHQMEMVEELCEAVAIIDRGKLVLGGPIRDVKRSSGRRSSASGSRAT